MERRRHLDHARASRGPVAVLVLGDFERLGESIALLREIRAGDGRHGQLDPRLPIVVLTAERGELGVLHSLEAGTDDHPAKPFTYPEPRARVSTVVRRAYEPRTVQVRRVGELVIDRQAREVHLRGQLVALSQKEFALFDTLYEQPARVYTQGGAAPRCLGFRSLGNKAGTGPYVDP